jgi:hypothetical protein
VQHREPMVPRPDAVAAFGFEMGEKSPYIVGTEIGQIQFADGTTNLFGQEEKE